MISGSIVSFVLSQILGLYLIIKAFLMFSRAKIYRIKILQAAPDSSIIVLAATIGMMIGIVLVGLHNRFELKPDIFITLLCWLVLILSLLWLSTPERMLMWTKKLYAGKGYYYLNAAMFFAGLMLLFRGIYHFATGTISFPIFEEFRHVLHFVIH